MAERRGVVVEGRGRQELLDLIFADAHPPQGAGAEDPAQNGQNVGQGDADGGAGPQGGDGEEQPGPQVNQNDGIPGPQDGDADENADAKLLHISNMT